MEAAGCLSSWDSSFDYDRDGVPSTSEDVNAMLRFTLLCCLDNPDHPPNPQESSISRRSLGAMNRADSPTFYPSGGTFHHPIAISLVSDDGSIVYYTVDGTEPSEASDAVSSGDLIVMEESGTLRAIASFDGTPFAARASGEAQAAFIVHSAGVFEMATTLWPCARNVSTPPLNYGFCTTHEESPQGAHRSTSSVQDSSSLGIANGVSKTFTLQGYTQRTHEEV